MLTSQSTKTSVGTVELQQKIDATSAELNQFAYVAVHDLKAPLRAIDNLALWIIEDIDDKQAVLKHTGLIQTRIKRAAKLLDDLLEYSQIGRNPSSSAKISLSALVQDLFAQSKAPAGFNLVTSFQVDEVWGPVPALEQVLGKLIHNAVLHHHQNQGVITISSAENNTELAISVQDDGPGIEAEFHHKVFTMFEKIASKDELEGSGLGLATAKKVAELHGASISLQSSLGAGACFNLLWPLSSGISGDGKLCS